MNTLLEQLPLFFVGRVLGCNLQITIRLHTKGGLFLSSARVTYRLQIVGLHVESKGCRNKYHFHAKLYDSRVT